MDVISTNLERLRKALATSKSKSKKQLQETVENLSSSLVLLNSSAPSPKVFQRLSSLLRSPLLPLYLGCTEQAVDLAASILGKVFDDGLCSHLGAVSSDSGSLKEGWEKVAGSLISGVMDFLETEDSDERKTVTADAFYPILCRMFFSQPVEHIAKLGASLRINGYMLISDTASHHPSNQAKLRVGKLLGPEKLGDVMFGTREYATLETLLNLLARLLPSSSASKSKHESFVRKVFSNRKGLNEDKISSIISLLDGVAVRNWEDTATKLYDQISATDIGFPQAFDVDIVTVCGVDFPQPESSDRFYVDNAALFINAQRDDGMYDSLQVAFGTITNIEISSSGERDEDSIRFQLSSIPILDDEPVNQRNPHHPLDLVVKIAKKDSSRFMDSLKHRHLDDKLVGYKRPSKPQLRVSITDPARLDMDDDLSPPEPHSPSQKAQQIQKFYDDSDPPDLGTKKRKPDEGDDTRLQKPSKSVKPIMEDQTQMAGASGAIVAEIDIGVVEDTTLISSHLVGKADTSRRSKALSKVENAIAITNFTGKSPTKKDELDDGGKSPVRRRAEKTKAKSKGQALSDEQEKAQTIQVVTTSPKPNVATKEPESTKRKENKRAKKPPQAKKQKPSSPETKSTRKANEKVKQDPKSKERELSSPSDPEEPVKESGNRRRAKRASAVAATAKLAVREYSDEDDAPSNAAALDDLPSNEDSGMYKLKPLSAPDIQPSSPLAHLNDALASDNIQEINRSAVLGTSKATKMKGKRPLDAAADNTGAIKKSRIDQEGPTDVLAQKASRIEKEYKASATASRPRNYKHREHKGQRSSPTKAVNDVDWDVLPSNAQAKPRTPSVTPVKKKKADLKKENEEVKKVQTKPQERNRAPLTEVEVVNSRDDVNKVTQNDKKPILSKALVKEETITMKEAPESARPPKNRAPQGKPETNHRTVGSVLSLADVLLKGAHVPHNISSDSNSDKPFPEGNLAPHDLMEIEDPPNMELTVEMQPEILLEPQRGRDDEENDEENDESHDLLRLHEQDGLADAAEDPVFAPALEEPKEVIDLTTDGEMPHRSLFTPVAEKSARVIDQSSSPESKFLVKAKAPARPKVKFDDRLQFKSASSERVKEIETRDILRMSAKGGNERRDERGRAKIKQLQEQVLRGEERHAKRHQHRWSKEPGMTDIIGVLDSLHNAIIDNIASKSLEVRSDIRVARDELLGAAASDLFCLREESIAHLNNLFSTETEYANFSRKLATGYEEALRANHKLDSFVRQGIENHDRNSISKKMPRSIFTSRLPLTITKWTQ